MPHRPVGNREVPGRVTHPPPRGACGEAHSRPAGILQTLAAGSRREEETGPRTPDGRHAAFPSPHGLLSRLMSLSVPHETWTLAWGVCGSSDGQEGARCHALRWSWSRQGRCEVHTEVSCSERAEVWRLTALAAASTNESGCSGGPGLSFLIHQMGLTVLLLQNCFDSIK